MTGSFVGVDVALDSGWWRRMLARWGVALIVVGIAAGCTAETAPVAAVDPTSRATLDDLADPDLDLEDIAGVELDGLAPETAGFCEAFAAAELLWIEDAIVPLQIVVDAWRDVDDAPAQVAEDVAVMRELADRRMEWHLGRIDRDDRPVIDLAMAERLERIADQAAASCDLPLVVGPAGNVDLTPAEQVARCKQSQTNMAQGIALYERLRAGEPVHGQQIELAAWVELLRNPDEAEFWFASDFHGIGPEASITALPPC